MTVLGHNYGRPTTRAAKGGGLLTRLHEEGWIITLCLVALVAISGVYGMYRVARQEQVIQEMRAELVVVDEMLKNRTQIFTRIEANLDKVMRALKVEPHEPVPR